MRLAACALAFALSACGSSSSPGAAAPARAGVVTVADGSRCTLPAGAGLEAEQASCTGKGDGCAYQQELVCYGTDPGPEARAEETRAAEAGEVPCACVCPEDRERCALTP